MGRLLITCVLHAERVLTQPVLYPSLYFRQRRAEYYDALQRVRADGDWEGWLRSYLEGAAAVSREAADTSRADRDGCSPIRVRPTTRVPCCRDLGVGA